jgi:hypothetical protein
MSLDPKDETNIGNILIKMGAISEDELSDAVEMQERSSIEVMLGKLLIANEICTREQISMALAAQKGLRSGDKPEAALAIADIASYRKGRTNGKRDRVMEKARTATGDSYPAVGLSAKPTDG